VDFEDVRTVMTSSGVAIMGMAEAEGEDRAMRAAQEALASPLLNDNDIRGAKYVLLNVALGDRTISMDEMTEITDHIQDAAGSSADVIWGYCSDENLGDRIRVTVIATGFDRNELTGTLEERPVERKRIPLDAELPTMITAPIANPVTGASAPKASAPVAPEPAAAEPYIKTVAPAAPVAATPAPAPVVPAPAVPAQEQRRIEFEVEAPRAQQAEEVPPVAEKKVFDLYAAPAEPQQPLTAEHEQPAVLNTAPHQQPAPSEQRATPVQHQARVEERLSRMREMSLRLRTPNGLADMEREPAYKRRNITLNDAPHSTDSNVSRYTLSEETDENGERRVELRRNNPFLHDNVD
jgi:cell division protein FtsZ